MTASDLIQENDQRRQLEVKRKKREEAKKAAEEAKRKKLAAKGEAPAPEPEEPQEETCVIDNLLKEIRAGTTLRQTGQNSVHKRRRRTSQLNKGDLEKLNQIVEKAASTPRKSTPVAGNESQFKFPVVDEDNENESEISKAGEVSGVETPSDSVKTTQNNGQSTNNHTEDKKSNTPTQSNNYSQGINGETNDAALPNGESSTVEAKADHQGGDLSVTEPQRLTSPVVRDNGFHSHQGGDLSVTELTAPPVTQPQQRLTSPMVGDTALHSHQGGDLSVTELTAPPVTQPQQHLTSPMVGDTALHSHQGGDISVTELTAPPVTQPQQRLTSPMVGDTALHSHQGGDISVTELTAPPVTQPQQRLTSPVVGDTALNSQTLPTCPANDQLRDEEGLPNTKTAINNPNKETGSLDKSTSSEASLNMTVSYKAHSFHYSPPLSKYPLPSNHPGSFLLHGE